MVTQTYTPSDGKPRTIDAVVVGKELRIHRIYGDVTDPEVLKELAQEACIANDCETVTLPQ